MKKLNDRNLRLVFTPSLECRRDHGAPTARTWPCDMIPDGWPICQECGEEYHYSHTEIKERTVTVHVHGGVAYAPTSSVNGVTVKVVDHDNH